MSLECALDCGEGWDVHNERMPVARKNHKCEECGQSIKPGEVYHYHWGIFYGDPVTHKACERCGDLRSSFGALGYCYYYGSFLSDYAEWLDHDELPRPAWLRRVLVSEEYKARHKKDV